MRGELTSLEIRPRTPDDVGWVSGQLHIDDPAIDLAGTFRAPFCEVFVCI